MQFGRFHGIALITLGVMLLGLQTMLYMTTKQVVTGPPEFLTTKLEHETYPVPILGIASLMASVAIRATLRRAEESVAKNAVK
jgi:ribose/xylose/arabinose/galactoside ABC-type transport system permease subunit